MSCFYYEMINHTVIIDMYELSDFYSVLTKQLCITAFIDVLQH